MELTPRLRSVAEQVPAGAVLADIGTDHAYLPTWLLLEGRIPRAIAADLRVGPLERARETAARYGVSKQISFRLCDGLSAVAPDEADVIAIAGMGGETIASILEAAPWTRQADKLLLLQPMTAFADLRSWLSTHGYCIEDETISREGKRLYTCLRVRAGAMAPMTLAELWAGRQSGDPLRRDYLAMMEAKLERILQGHLAAELQDEAEIDSVRLILDEIRQMKGEL